MPRTPNETRQSQFRLTADTLQQLDRIADFLSRTDPAGRTATRADAVRFAVLVACEKISKKPGKRG